jgi:methyl-accepting chemotaxis protein
LDKIVSSTIDQGIADVIVAATNSREHLLQAEIYANAMVGYSDPDASSKTDSQIRAAREGLEALGRSEWSDSDKELLLSAAANALESYIETHGKVKMDQELVRKAINTDLAQATDQMTYNAEQLVGQFLALQKSVRADAEDHILLAEIEMLVAAGVGLATGLVLAMVLGSAIANPIISITGSMAGLATGDLDTEIPAQQRADEVGKMARSVQVLKVGTPHGPRSRSVSPRAI